MQSASHPSLFANAPDTGVSGLTYVTDAVTETDAHELTRFIATLDFKPFQWRGFTGNRRTVSFGCRYDFNGGGFQRAEPMPLPLCHARALAARAVGRGADAFAQCSVIEYAPGAGIGWHKDRPHFEDVMGLSLLAPCRLRLKRENTQGGWERSSVLLEPRSAYLLEGEARHQWRHSIPALDRLRYSLTFRTLAP